MSTLNVKSRIFFHEFVFGTSRSSGAGGQNVNKVNTKVELRFSISNSQLLSDEEKEMLRQKYPNKINDNDEFILVSQTERSQLKNKENVIGKFYMLVEKALTPRKKRKPTKPSFSSVAKRLDKKRITSEKKSFRKVPDESS